MNLKEWLNVLLPDLDVYGLPVPPVTRTSTGPKYPFGAPVVFVADGGSLPDRSEVGEVRSGERGASAPRLIGPECGRRCLIIEHVDMQNSPLLVLHHPLANRDGKRRGIGGRRVRVRQQNRHGAPVVTRVWHGHYGERSRLGRRDLGTGGGIDHRSRDRWRCRRWSR